MEPAGGVFGGLEGNIGQTRIALWTKLWLYDPYSVPVLVYGSETWAVTKSKERKIDTFCWKFSSAYLQCPVIGFHNQHGNSEKKGCATAVHTHSEKGVSLLGHVAWMPEGFDTRSILVADVPGVFWRRLRSRPRSSWLRTVRADLDLMDTSLEGDISFDNIVLWRQMVDAITYRATLPMRE